jgi:alkylhydroperoxidase family enzyme
MAEHALSGLAIGLIEALWNELWGFPPRLTGAVIGELGPFGALTWFARHMPRYQRTVRALGPLRTHLACTAISLDNGCRYCSFGHAYAVELVYLKQRGQVFPVDARTMCGWTELPPAALRAQLCDVLQRAALHAEVLWVDRTLALARGEQRAVDRQEARIEHLVHMFALLNGVGIAGKLEPDDAHDPINKDRASKARNAALRGPLA